MPKKVEEKLYILSPSRAYLSSIKLMGPIVHPIQVTKLAAVEILMSGAEVYEYIPATKETIKLTFENINDPNRCAGHKASTTAPPIESIKADSKVIAPMEPVIKKGVPNIAPHVEPTIEESLDTLKDENGDEVDVPAGDVNDEPTEIVTEEAQEPVADEEPAKVSVIDSIEFEYNEDGTINETNINWSSYSKNDRKAIRAHINAVNATIAKN